MNNKFFEFQQLDYGEFYAFAFGFVLVDVELD